MPGTNCYHVVAACMATGQKETTKKNTVNLTQLRKNVHKRSDKTSGRRRPRVHDTDVVAAGDSDDATTAAVAGLTHPVADDDDDATSDVAAMTGDNDRCITCGFPHPLQEKTRRTKHVQWMQCEGCSLWYHNVCASVGLKCS